MAEEKEAKTSKSPGIMTLVKAVAFISIIVLLQIAAASMILPSSEETAAIAEQLAAAEFEREQEEGSEGETNENEKPMLATTEMVEVALGSFHVLSYNPETGSRSNVDFELYATVLEEEESEFFNLFADNEQRLREQILVTLRGTDLTDLTDPTLDLVKRKILEKANRALGKPLLHETIFSKFSFEER